MRALEPVTAGYAGRDGVKLYWEQFGDGEPTIVLLPAWSIVHSRFWKAQVPYLARHFRVVTFDGRGCGRSDRPIATDAYNYLEYAADTIAVLDATETSDAVLVGVSRGALWGVNVAADWPDRVRGLVCLASGVPLGTRHPERLVYSFSERLDTTQEWAKYNRYHWLEGGYRDFVEYFGERVYTERHSTKQIEDFIGWGLDVEPGDAGGNRRGAQSVRPGRVPEHGRTHPRTRTGDSWRCRHDHPAHHRRGARRGHRRSVRRDRRRRSLPPRS